jgi:hypothetical protein
MLEGADSVAEGAGDPGDNEIAANQYRRPNAFLRTLALGPRRDLATTHLHLYNSN